MKKRKLGSSELSVSEISFGCMSLGEHAQLNDRILRKAFDQGINFFDTADVYHNGENEIQVGKSLRPIRKDVIIATKVGNQIKKDGEGFDWNPSKAYILDAVEHSLRRLQTDYIDLYQLHGGMIEDPIDETVEAFEQLKKEGKIRYYGISSIRPNVIKAYVEKSAIQSVMMQYSLLDRRPEESILELLENNNISVITRGALAQGLLVGKPAKEYLQFTSSEVAKAARSVERFSSQLSISAVSIALSYVLSHEPVVSAVTGVRTEEQLDDAVEAAKSIQKLSPDQLSKLKQDVRDLLYESHR